MEIRLGCCLRLCASHRIGKLGKLCVAKVYWPTCLLSGCHPPIGGVLGRPDFQIAVPRFRSGNICRKTLCSKRFCPYNSIPPVVVTSLVAHAASGPVAPEPQ